MRVGEPCIYVDPDNTEIEATLTKLYPSVDNPDLFDAADAIYFLPGDPNASAVTVTNVLTNRVAGGPPYVYQRSV